ncbi:MAG: TAXI family TRAP transporter solute-binding subunit, partial [Pseudomonadota bacterium]
GLVLFASSPFAPTLAQSTEELRQKVNENTIYVVGGSLTGTNSALAWDMAKLFDEGYDLRVLPILGRGSIKTTEDILYLKGVDAGMVQADVLEFFTDLNVFPGIRDKLKYITAMHQEEVHIVVRRDSGYASLDDLAGKKVNFGPTSSGTFLTSSVIFDRKGIVVEVLSEPYDFALEKLQNGEIDALTRIAGAPTSFLEKVTSDSALMLLPVDDIGAPYLTATLSSDQYPGLIALGDTVKTVAIPSVLVAYDHPEGERRARVEKFIQEFRARLPELQAGASFHKKWQDVDFSTQVGGWSRWGSAAPNS